MPRQGPCHIYNAVARLITSSCTRWDAHACYRYSLPRTGQLSHRRTGQANFRPLIPENAWDRCCRPYFSLWTLYVCNGVCTFISVRMQVIRYNQSLCNWIGSLDHNLGRSWINAVLAKLSFTYKWSGLFCLVMCVRDFFRAHFETDMERDILESVLQKSE